MYITIAQKGILILNSHEAASDLLGRKGAIYSDRPRWIGESLYHGVRSLT